MPNETNPKIKLVWMIAVWSKIIKIINIILININLRKGRRYWGAVYDSVTKQPLDPVMVKLIYVGDEATQTCVTDLEGHYGFLAHPGKFKMLAKKTNYTFPSTVIKGDSDGIYNNLYHGEFFELYDDYEVVAPNIPMDPVGKDWNQEAKQKIVRTNPGLQLFLKSIVVTLFWVAFCIAVIFVYFEWKQYHMSAIIPLYFFIALFLLAVLMPEIRLWGLLEQSEFTSGEILLELKNPLVGVVFGKASILPDGKFFLRANPGIYDLHAKHKSIDGEITDLGSVSVTVEKEGVLNKTFTLK